MICALCQVSLFENDESDFVIPIGLYTSRLQQLEQALVAAQDAVDIEVYYRVEKREDPELTAFTGHIVSVVDTEEEEGDLHLRGSGYRTVRVKWDSGEYDHVSPWEVHVSSFPPASNRKTLDDNQKKAVLDAINSVKQMEGVGNVFADPVDDMVFTDYQSRVEIPMDLSFVMSRVETDYYSCMLSVVADVHLIKENCLKYNGELHDASTLAIQMLETFEGLVLAEPELSEYRNFRQLVVEAPVSTGLVEVTSPNQPRQSDSSVAETSPMPVGRTLRRRSTRRSTLEDLSPPAAPTMSNVASARQRGDRIRRRSNQRSVLEVSSGRERRTLETTSSLATRGRRQQNRAGAHRTLRSTRQASTNQELTPQVSSRGQRASAIERGRQRTARTLQRQQSVSPARSPPRISMSRRRQPPSVLENTVERPSRFSRSTRAATSYMDQASDEDQQDTRVQPNGRTAAFESRRQPHRNMSSRRGQPGVSSPPRRRTSRRRAVQIDEGEGEDLVLDEEEDPQQTIDGEESSDEESFKEDTESSDQNGASDESEDDDNEFSRDNVPPRVVRESRSSRSRPSDHSGVRASPRRMPNRESRQGHEQEDRNQSRARRQIQTSAGSISRRTTKRSRTASHARTSRRAERSYEERLSSGISESDDEVENPSLSRTRRRTTTAPTRQHAVAQNRDSHLGRKRSRVSHSNSGSRRSSREQPVTYVDPSESEFGSDVDDEPKKRPKKNPPPSPPAVVVSTWPDVVPTGRISDFVDTILDRLVSA